MIYLPYTLMRKVLPVYSDGSLAKITIKKPSLAEGIEPGSHPC